jgi:hypothetical protein
MLAVLAICAFAWGVYMLLTAWSFGRTAHRVQGLIVDRDNANFTVQYMVDGQMLQLTEALPTTKGMSGVTRQQLARQQRPGALRSSSTDASKMGQQSGVGPASGDHGRRNDRLRRRDVPGRDGASPPLTCRTL